MENNTFKGSLFGGFNRQDVINYIEKASKESAELLQANQERIAQLEKQVEELTAERDALRTQVAGGEEKERSLQEALCRSAADCEERARALQEEQAAHAQAIQALEAEQSRCAQYAAEQEKLTTALAAAQKEADEYHTLKNNIAEVELEAKHRAETIVSEAGKRADDMMQKAQMQSRAILENARKNAESTVQQANTAAAAVRQKADKHAMLTRQQINTLLANCQEQYRVLMESYKGAALQAATALQKAQENMTHLPSVFDKISDGLNKLGDHAQKKD